MHRGLIYVMTHQKDGSFGLWQQRPGLDADGSETERIDPDGFFVGLCNILSLQNYTFV